jgi:hypothetical protein
VTREEPIPVRKLERYLLNELPAGTMREIEERLSRDPVLRAELEKLRLANEEILRRYPAADMAASIRRREAVAAPAPRTVCRSGIRPAWAALPTLALAVVALLVLPPLLRREHAPGPEYIGIKGGQASPGLQLLRQGRRAIENLPSGSIARRGDLLQLACFPAGATDGVILSIDGRGRVTLHFPESAGSATSLPQQRRFLLANAYELDDAPFFERFFFVSAREALPVSAILVKAGTLAADPQRAKTGRLDLPGRFRQNSLLIRKEEKP